MKTLLCVALASMATGLFAEDGPLKVGISRSLILVQEQRVEQIKTALRQTGLEFEFYILPEERSFNMLLAGDLAMGLWRLEGAMMSFPQLVKVPTSVGKVNYWLVTRPESAALCELDEAERAKKTVVGVRGVKYFQRVVYPKFRRFEEANQFAHARDMLWEGRADFTVWDKHAIARSLAVSNKPLHVCDQTPFVTFEFFSYLHQGHGQFLDIIDQAYSTLP